MNYENLFKNGSLKFVGNFIGKIAYDGLGMERNDRSELVINLVAICIIVWLLYKVVFTVGKVVKFLLSCVCSGLGIEL